MPSGLPLFRSAFESPDDEFTGRGVSPVVIDIIGPDLSTSLLGDYRLVLHVNPNSMSISYSKVIERGQTKGGWVEQHFGEGADSVSFDMASGGFMRLYTGLSNITGSGLDAGGTRRQTIAYDKYLDLRGVFHNKGAIYDSEGNIVFQGIIKVSFDGAVWYGWFNTFSFSEEAEKPYQFSINAEFTVKREVLGLKTTILLGQQTASIAERAQTEIDRLNELAQTRYDAAIEEDARIAAQAVLEATGQSTEVEPSAGAWSTPDEE
jgi:hypothetical protein